MVSTYPYPYNQAIWNVNDQKYFCTMVNKYRYPVDRCPELYQPIIKESLCSTFEQEYQQYQAEQSQTQLQTSEQPPEV